MLPRTSRKPSTGKPKIAARTKTRMSYRERQAAALELRLAGQEYAAIADELGYANKSGAYKAVQNALTAIIREPAEQLVTLEVARLDAMLRAVWKRIVGKGELGAIDRALKIMERRARLLGLDKPIEFDLHLMVREMANDLELTDNEAAALLTQAERFQLEERRKRALEQEMTV